MDLVGRWLDDGATRPPGFLAHARNNKLDSLLRCAARLFEKRYCLLARHAREVSEELFDRFAALEIVKQRLGGTRVPTKTSVPLTISGSE